MSPETASRKKRDASESTQSTPSVDGDHRKRRRNRTTQSCLNCHTSKRMCDRKRPACARCTQLGLTGLCVYEVDDPSQRSDSQDESARLLKRVAELEGVIRELKNKPHPRWVHSGTQLNEEIEKWHSRSRLPSSNDPEHSQSNAPSPPNSSSSDMSSNSPRIPPLVKGSNVYPTLPVGREPRSRQPSFCPSPYSTPSPPVTTPTEEYPQLHIGITNDMSHDYDIASMFLPYPNLVCSDDYLSSTKTAAPDGSDYDNPCSAHCGCIHEPTNYHVLLELSVRLRKATDTLSRTPGHQLGNSCSLNQRITELDRYITTALGNIAASSDHLSVYLHHGARSFHTGGNLISSSLFQRQMNTSPISQPLLTGLRSWDVSSITTPVSPISCDDTFMTWEPPRRS